MCLAYEQALELLEQGGHLPRPPSLAVATPSQSSVGVLNPARTRGQEGPDAA